MKMRTHSGAKKRLRVVAGGKLKRKQSGLRHLNSHMSSKSKRQLGKMILVDDANMLQMKRCLVL
ncbi:MAG TPA: 50S ribosomal protein L35 [Pseudobdellovibrionaceae bacterium]|nr:50S ribosomal protein L35 [Pseudobdellovibrionaceae bacterium]